MHSALLIALLTLPGFFYNLQPSEPYLTVFLEDEKNITSSQLDDHVWPADTYASLAFLLPVGLLAETIGYLPVVLVGMVAREATRALLLFGPGLTSQIVAQITYAGGHAANAVYFSLPYIFLQKSNALFAVATASQHIGYHFGNVLGSVVGQSLINVIPGLVWLFYISWIATTIGLVILLSLFCIPTEQPKVSLSRRFKISGVRSVLHLDGVTSAACLALLFASASWAILGNYFQQNMRESGMLKSYFGYVELSIETTFILATLPPLLIRRKHHSLVLGISLFCVSLVAVGCYLNAFLSINQWGFKLALNLGILFAFQLAAQSCITLISQRVTENKYALVYTFVQFLALVVATISSQIGVSFHFERSSGYYLVVAVQSSIGALLIASTILYLLISVKFRGNVTATKEMAALMDVSDSENLEQDHDVLSS